MRKAYRVPKDGKDQCGQIAGSISAHEVRELKKKPNPNPKKQAVGKKQIPRGGTMCYGMWWMSRESGFQRQICRRQTCRVT